VKGIFNKLLSRGLFVLLLLQFGNCQVGCVVVFPAVADPPSFLLRLMVWADTKAVQENVTIVELNLPSVTS